jgi:hypothetical protein
LANFHSGAIAAELLESVLSGGFEFLKVGLFHGEGLIGGIMLQVTVWMPYVFSR